mgnify:CR=1 FL=1
MVTCHTCVHLTPICKNIDTIKLAKMEIHATSQINHINDQNGHLSHVCTQFLVLGSVLEPDPARSFEKHSEVLQNLCGIMYHSHNQITDQTLH